MKKIVFILAMVLIALVSNAQGWVNYYVEADELLDRSETYGMCYTNGEFQFIINDNVDNDFLLISPTVFNYETGAYRGGAEGGERIYGVVGIYDNSGKLLYKYDKFVFETSHGVSYMAHANKYSHMGGNNRKNTKKIIDYIKNSTGFVRLVIPLNGTTKNFDIKVECMGNTQLKFK